MNREYAEVLVEQTISGRTDTSYVYGADRLSFDTHYGSSGYYLYDPRGSVTGITNKKGQIYQSYRYNAFGEITFGEPKYDNEYTYNGESYNPNIESQYLRARYYNVTLASFITEDSYLGDITSPLTLNRYNYCVSSPLNYVDPSGYMPNYFLPSDAYRRALMLKETEAFFGYMQGNSEKSIEEGIANYTGYKWRGIKEAAAQRYESFGTAIQSYNYGKLASVLKAGFTALEPAGIAMSWVKSIFQGDFDTLYEATRDYEEMAEYYLEEVEELAKNKTAFYLGSCVGDLEVAAIGVVAVSDGVGKVATGTAATILFTASGAAVACDTASLSAVLTGAVEIAAGVTITGYGIMNTADDIENFVDSLGSGNKSSGAKHVGNAAEGGINSNEPSSYLQRALKNQGLEETPSRLKDVWVEGDYKYTVRVHEGNSKYTDADSIYRVSRQSTILDEHGQGTGLEYLGTDGNWYHESVLTEFFKGGTPNPNFNEAAARMTHIPISGGN